MKRDRLLGIPYDNVMVEDVLKKTEEFLKDGMSHVMVFISLPTLMMAHRNKNLRLFFELADLIIPSGKHIYWAVKLLKRTIKEKIDSSQLVKMLMFQSVELSKTVYLFGGKGDIVDRAYNNLKKDIPKLFVIGRYRGNYNRYSHDNVVKAIGKASPDYFFIGLGSPHEENWVVINREKINAKLIILVEGLFDLFAGNRKIISGYIRNWDDQKISRREIPSQHSIRKLWYIPVFRVLVLLEKIFHKK